MKQDEKEENFSEEGNPEGPVDESPQDAFEKAFEIEHIDDSQLPQSIKDVFKR